MRKQSGKVRLVNRCSESHSELIVAIFKIETRWPGFSLFDPVIHMTQKVTHLTWICGLTWHDLNPDVMITSAHMHVYHYPLFENGAKRGLWTIASCWKDVGNFQHQYLSELLVNVYSYCLMVKVCLVVVCIWKPAFLKCSHKCDLASKTC